MNIVHYFHRCVASFATRLHGALRLLMGTTLLVGLCVMLADPQAPGRWLGALFSGL